MTTPAELHRLTGRTRREIHHRADKPARTCAPCLLSTQITVRRLNCRVIAAGCERTACGQNFRERTGTDLDVKHATVVVRLETVIVPERQNQLAGWQRNDRRRKIIGASNRWIGSERGIGWRVCDGGLSHPVGLPAKQRRRPAKRQVRCIRSIKIFLVDGRELAGDRVIDDDIECVCGTQLGRAVVRHHGTDEIRAWADGAGRRPGDHPRAVDAGAGGRVEKLIREYVRRNVGVACRVRHGQCHRFTDGAVGLRRQRRSQIHLVDGDVDCVRRGKLRRAAVLHARGEGVGARAIRFIRCPSDYTVAGNGRSDGRGKQRVGQAVCGQVGIARCIGDNESC